MAEALLITLCCLPFSDGTNKALSLATTRVGGFSDDEIALFEAMTPAVAVKLEIQALRRMARTLLDTYVRRPVERHPRAASALRERRTG